MLNLTTLLDLTETAMRAVAACCLMGMALLTGADVVGRAALNTPIFGSEEITAILATLAVGFSLPYAHRQGVHIGVEIVVRRLPRLARNSVKLVTDAAALVLFCIVTWRMWLYAGTMRDSGLVSMNLELPTYYVVYALSAGFFVFSLHLAIDVLRFFDKDGR